MRIDENYYAIVKYRGKERYFEVSASETIDDRIDLRVEYIDYNPNREWPGVWIKNGVSKLIKRFDKGSAEYEYFNLLKSNFNKIVEEEERRQSSSFIGTHNVLRCYKKALQSTPNTLNITI